MPRLTSFSRNTSRAALTRSSVSACRVTPSSPAQAMLALVPRKSNRCASSLPAWFRALSTSWRSTLLTMSNDASATAVSSRCGAARAAVRRLVRSSGTNRGGLPEWPMGADCKSVGLAYEGSNPSPATPRYDGPRPLQVGGRRRVGAVSERGGPGAGDGCAFEGLPAEEEPAEGDVGVPRAAHRHLGAV